MNKCLLLAVLVANVLLTSCAITPEPSLTDSPLEEAARVGLKEEVKKLIAEGADVNARGESGATPLISASARGITEIVKSLIKAGADVNAGWTSENAVSRYHGITLGTRIDENTGGGSGSFYIRHKRNPPLIYAVNNRHPDVVRALIDGGADVNFIDESTSISRHWGLAWTPLMLASFRGYPDIVRILTEKGADANIVNYSDRTALILAARERHPNTIEALIDGGADVNFRNNDGITALMVAASGCPPYRGCDEVCRVLLERGADVDATDLLGGTALMRAVFHSDQNSVRVLLDGGADVNIAISKPLSHSSIINSGTTALMLAAYFLRSAEITRMLIEKGADVNATFTHTQLKIFGSEIIDRPGTTSLMLAAYKGAPEVVDLLIENGADINAEIIINDGRRVTAAYFAEIKGHDEVLRVLKEAGGVIPDTTLDAVGK